MVKINRGREVVMIAAASRALEIKAQHPSWEYEEILKEVIRTLEYDEPRGDTEAKISAVSAVDKVLKLKQGFPKLTNKQVVQKLVDNSKKSFIGEMF
jgi:hypothetical protein